MTTEIVTSKNSKFTHPINEIVKVITHGSETKYVKGEYFGYFLNRLVRNYLQTNDFQNHSFRSHNFSPTKIKELNSSTDKIAVYLNKSEPIEGCEELHFVITEALTQSIIAEFGSSPFSKEKFNQSKRYYVGMISHLKHSLMQNTKFVSGENPLIQIRRFDTVMGLMEELTKL